MIILANLSIENIYVCLVHRFDFFVEAGIARLVVNKCLGDAYQVTGELKIIVCP